MSDCSQHRTSGMYPYKQVACTPTNSVLERKYDFIMEIREGFSLRGKHGVFFVKMPKVFESGHFIL